MGFVSLRKVVGVAHFLSNMKIHSKKVSLENGPSPDELRAVALISETRGNERQKSGSSALNTNASPAPEGADLPCVFI